VRGGGCSHEEPACGGAGMGGGGGVLGTRRPSLPVIVVPPMRVLGSAAWRRHVIASSI